MWGRSIINFITKKKIVGTVQMEKMKPKTAVKKKKRWKLFFFTNGQEGGRRRREMWILICWVSVSLISCARDSFFFFASHWFFFFLLWILFIQNWVNSLTWGVGRYWHFGAGRGGKRVARVFFWRRRSREALKCFFDTPSLFCFRVFFFFLSVNNCLFFFLRGLCVCLCLS